MASFYNGVSTSYVLLRKSADPGTSSDGGYIYTDTTGDVKINNINGSTINLSTIAAGTAKHADLTDITEYNDDHIQYALLAGRGAGQTLIGGTASGNNLTLRPNSANTTSGSVIINSTKSSIDNSSGSLVVNGGLGVGGDIYATNINAIAGNLNSLTVTGTSTLGNIESNVSGNLANFYNVNVAGSLSVATFGSASNNLSILGGPLNLNNNVGTSTTNIGTGNTNGNVLIGGGNTSQVIELKGGTSGGSLNLNVNNNSATNIGTNTTATVAIGSNNNQNVFISGNVSINDSVNRPTKIGTGTSTGNIEIGSGNTTQQISIKGGNSGTGVVLINDAANSASTNIGTNGTIGNITIGSGNSTQQIRIKSGTSGFTLINHDAGATTSNIGTGDTSGNIYIGSTSTSTTTAPFATGQQVFIKGGNAAGKVYINNNSATADTNIGTGTTTGNVNIKGNDSVSTTPNIGPTTGEVNIISYNTAAVSPANSRVINIGHDSATTLTNIGTGTTTGKVSIGGGNTTQLIELKSGTTAGSLNLNVSNNSPTNIGTGGSTGLITIGGGSNNVIINPSVSLNLSGKRITNLADPVDVTDAATRGWVITNAGNPASATLLATSAASAISIGTAGIALFINNNKGNTPTYIGGSGTTGSVLIGEGAASQAISIGSGGNAGDITIGSSESTLQNILLRGRVNIRGSTANGVRINNDVAGNVTLGGSVFAQTITIGSTTSSGGHQNIVIGNGSDTAGSITIGSTGNSKNVNINGNVKINNNNNNTTEIGTGTTSSTVTIGNQINQTINIKSNNGTNFTAPSAINIGVGLNGSGTTINQSAINIGNNSAGEISIGSNFNGISLGGINIGGNSVKRIAIGEGSTVTQNILIGDASNVNNANKFIYINGNVNINTESSLDTVIGKSGNSTRLDSNTIILANLPSSASGTTLGVNGSNILIKITSTRAHKYDIEPISLKYNSTDVISQLEPKKFKSIFDNSECVGLIAEEVFPIIPELVPVDNEGAPVSVRYDLLSVILLEELKKSNARVTALEQQVADILSRL